MITSNHHVPIKTAMEWVYLSLVISPYSKQGYIDRQVPSFDAKTFTIRTNLQVF